MAAITTVPGLVLAKNINTNSYTTPTGLSAGYSTQFQNRTVYITCDNAATATAVVSIQFSFDNINGWTQLSNISGLPVITSYNPTTPETSPVVKNFVIPNTPGIYYRAVVTEGNTTSVAVTNLNVVII